MSEPNGEFKGRTEANLISIASRVDKIETKIDDLLAFKNRWIGITIGTSAIVALLMRVLLG